MSNDLSRITEGDDSEAGLPWQIWYPQRAAAATYRELARRKPDTMMAPVARALVFADYQEVSDELVDRIEPYYELVEEVRTRSEPALPRVPSTELRTTRHRCRRGGTHVPQLGRWAL
jgi:hypothetical protein